MLQLQVMMNFLMIYQSISWIYCKGLYFFKKATRSQGSLFHQILSFLIGTIAFLTISLNFSFISYVLNRQ